MRALILAAGRGSRLGPMTRALPKGLVELAGRPLLDWQIEAMNAAGCQELGIVKGFQADKLSYAGVCNFINPRWQSTQMVQSLVCASKWLKERPCLISYADILTSQACISQLIAARGDLVISSNLLWRPLWEARFTDPLEDVESFKTDGQGHLLEIGDRPHSLAEIEGQYMGLLKMSPQGWGWIESYLADLAPVEADKLDMTSLLQALLKQGKVIDILPTTEPWLELDTPGDYALYQKAWAAGKLALPLREAVLW
jgi:L-glutamine-phosphate cytidylyltransferase